MDCLLAAIDLGSNTFRLAIAQPAVINGKPEIVIKDQMRELIAMANGLDSNNRLDQATINQALISLGHFGQRIQGFNPKNVRAVATNTFRIATNIDEFLPAAEKALGFPIEIISGTEEAQLIYLGVNHKLPEIPGNRLILDIGGGSTEFIIGHNLHAIQLASLGMGCAAWTKLYFSDGLIYQDNMLAAINHARTLVKSLSDSYKGTGWQQAYGSSGTAKGVLAVLEENGFSSGGINLPAMHQLKEELVKAKVVRLQDWAGLKQERVPLLGGGLAILIAIFEELGIDIMYTGDGALRVGILVNQLMPK